MLTNKTMTWHRLNLHDNTQVGLFLEILTEVGITYRLDGTLVIFKATMEDAQAVWSLYVEDFMRRFCD